MAADVMADDVMADLVDLDDAGDGLGCPVERGLTVITLGIPPGLVLKQFSAITCFTCLHFPSFARLKPIQSHVYEPELLISTE